MTTAAEVARGVSRLLIQEGFSPILEFTLANGRRLDVAALGGDGTVVGVEIKVAIPDLKGDMKWPEYLEFCELFYFAIPPDFPDEFVPPNTGLIVADRYGGAIVRPSPIAQHSRQPPQGGDVALRQGRGRAPCDDARTRGRYPPASLERLAKLRRSLTKALRSRKIVLVVSGRSKSRPTASRVSHREKILHAAARARTIRSCCSWARSTNATC